MLLNRNIKTHNPNSFYHLIIGLMFGGMTAWVAISGEKKPKGIDQFDWLYIFIFSFFAIWFIIKGLRAILSKAFIVVDQEKISIKPDESSKKETIRWNDVKLIREVVNNLEVKLKNGENITIYLSYFSNQQAAELRESIISTAKKKNIPIEEYVSSKYITSFEEQQDKN